MPEMKLIEKKTKKGKNKADMDVYMLYAVWFKTGGGERRYREYLNAVGPLIRKVGGRKLKSLVVDRELIGEFDADLIYFVEYPDWQAYKDFANSADHHKVAYLREEALDKTIVLRCKRPDQSYWD
jgi:uncharacterized protein (DUF1330 family)